MATNSSKLAWKIPRTEEPGGPQSKGCKRGEYDLATKQQFSKQAASHCWSAKRTQTLTSQTLIFRIPELWNIHSVKGPERLFRTISPFYIQEK